MSEEPVLSTFHELSLFHVVSLSVVLCGCMQRAPLLLLPKLLVNGHRFLRQSLFHCKRLTMTNAVIEHIRWSSSNVLHPTSAGRREGGAIAGKFTVVQAFRITPRLGKWFCISACLVVPSIAICDTTRGCIVVSVTRKIHDSYACPPPSPPPVSLHMDGTLTGRQA